MIDQSALQRDVTAHINDWPVQMRHYYDPNNPTSFHQAAIGFSATDDVSQLLDGGLLDRPDADVILRVADFIPPPKNRDRVDIQLADGSWFRYEVKRAPDHYDPLGPDFNIHIGTPNA